MYKKIDFKNGFTLIEIMISLGIFAIVAVIAVGALLKVLDANKKAQSIQDAVTNLSFAMETMSRDLRTGTKYDCGTSYSLTPTPTACPSFNSTQPLFISFISSERATDNSGQLCGSLQLLVYSYEFIPDPNNSGYYLLKKAKQGEGCSPSSGAMSSFENIVSPQNVKIKSYSVVVNNINPSQYPLALVHITGYAGIGTSTQTYFSLQTAASSRQR